MITLDLGFVEFLQEVPKSTQRIQIVERQLQINQKFGGAI